MTSKRVSLWGHEHRERYLAASREAAEQAAARRDGEHTARDLAHLWQGLTPEEKDVMEYLLLKGSPTIVALHDDGLLDGLIAKGLLQKPAGVGTLFMNHYETTYDVPAAVWRALNDSRHHFLPYSEADSGRRCQEAHERLHGRILVLESASSPGPAQAPARVNDKG
jgi:hypothetical protein